MLELASVGAKVLQTRSVGLAMKEGVRVQVLSSFLGDDAIPADELPGTLIVSDEEMDQLVEKGDMERQLVTGIAHDKNEAKDRKSAVWGKSVSVRVDPGGRRFIKKTKHTNKIRRNDYTKSLHYIKSLYSSSTIQTTDRSHTKQK